MPHRIDTACAIGIGLVLHQYFKRVEPYPARAFLTTLGSNVLLQIVLSFFLFLDDRTHIRTRTLLIGTIRSLLECFCVTATTTLVSVAVYRLSPWHPLARYPGPILHRLTKLRIAYAAWNGTNFRDLEWMHAKYGTVVRIGPNELSIAEVAAIPLVSALPKDRAYRGRIPLDGGRSVVDLNGIDHAHRRKMWDHGLGREQLVSYAEAARRIGKQMLVHLDVAAEKGTEVDLTELVRLFAFDFMSVFAFGKESRMTEMGKDEAGMIHSMSKAFIAADITGHIWWLGSRLSAFPIPTLIRYYAEYGRLAVQFFKERATRETVSYDLWHYLMDKGAAHRLNVPDLFREALVAIGAGADSVANATINTMYLLIKHPECMARAREEIRHLVDTGAEPWNSVEVHNSMPYLNACIDESLRLLNVVPVIPSRSVPIGSGGKIIASHFVPEGTEVIVPPIILHKDERYFSPKPNSFHPERWLLQEEPDQWHTRREAHIPFSSGIHNCAGKNLARMEMVVLLSLVLDRYEEVEFGRGFDVDRFPDRVRENLVAEVGPMVVRLKKRKTVS